jgi:hypothetical protein
MRARNRIIHFMMAIASRQARIQVEITLLLKVTKEWVVIGFRQGSGGKFCPALPLTCNSDR